jgi:hypothetical protein
MLLAEIGDCRARHPHRDAIADDAGQAPVAVDSGNARPRTAPSCGTHGWQTATATLERAGMITVARCGPSGARSAGSSGVAGRPRTRSIPAMSRSSCGSGTRQTRSVRMARSIEMIRETLATESLSRPVKSREAERCPARPRVVGYSPWEIAIQSIPARDAPLARPGRPCLRRVRRPGRSAPSSRLSGRVARGSQRALRDRSSCGSCRGAVRSRSAHVQLSARSGRRTHGV